MTSLLPRSGMPEHFSIRITSAEKDKLVGEIDVDHRHLNKGGIVHGGALLAFADDLGGTVAGLNIPEGFRTTTIESKSNIFHSCPPGRLTGIAVPVHIGRRTVVVQTSIYRSDGKLIVTYLADAAGAERVARVRHLDEVPITKGEGGMTQTPPPAHACSPAAVVAA
jgi:1,4-dihydroxy-2-naphthoyl-CoA hydrolase